MAGNFGLAQSTQRRAVRIRVTKYCMCMWHHCLTSKLKINEGCSRNPTSRKRVHFIFSGFYITYVNLPEHVITEHVVAISLKMWWLLSWRCCGYFVEDVVATWLEIWWLVGCRRVGYMVVEMWWLYLFGYVLAT